MQNLQKEIVELSNLSLKEGMGTDELVITLLSNAVVAASHLGLSKQFCEDQFIDAVDDIYGEDEEDEERECHCGICKTEVPQDSYGIKIAPPEPLTIHFECQICKARVTEEKETHQASPEMKLFFQKLLDLKNFVKIYCIKGALDSRALSQDIYQRLDEIIKEKK